MPLVVLRTGLLAAQPSLPKIFEEDAGNVRILGGIDRPSAQQLIGTWRMTLLPAAALLFQYFALKRPNGGEATLRSLESQTSIGVVNARHRSPSSCLSSTCQISPTAFPLAASLDQNA